MFAVSAARTNAGIHARNAAAVAAMAEAAAVRAVQALREQEERNEEAVAKYRAVQIRRFNSARGLAEAIGAQHGLSFAELVGVSRNRDYVKARDAAIRAVADARPDMSLPAIGRLFKRDHTTIIHSLRKTRTEGKLR